MAIIYKHYKAINIRQFISFISICKLTKLQQKNITSALSHFISLNTFNCLPFHCTAVVCTYLCTLHYLHNTLYTATLAMPSDGNFKLCSVMSVWALIGMNCSNCAICKIALPALVRFIISVEHVQ